MIVQGAWKPTDSYNRMLNAVQDFSAVVSKSRACDLAAQVTSLNREVIDMEHYIEFNDLDELDELKTYRKLRDILRHRRNVKQVLELTNRILDCGVRQMTDGHTIAAPTARVQKMYTPRGDGGIFEKSNTAINEQ